ncbi:CO or xanthine dehydrogenase, Mo-binding subunit [Salinihabitans flavidus]|uniref:CO or xanthine dehydrogenase, Mo-binding subunit n=1 Tax=Salinihabitans flavidus TaxID=569882 RepID=A0A1H8PCB0_9RHOB|nr:xanthine dehydrogenase family protein molybdopterin-binding subunit [Salinihabitans flavidus]SEO39173.1 CO or xanthine dehydrogenase, Mo-binding subunit [Salinihabitans flavidus]
MSIKDIVIPPSRRKIGPAKSYNHIGKPMKRLEDPPLLTGTGQFIDDVVLPHMAHAAVLRSPLAHARIVKIDTSAAEALEGVVCVLTGEDVAKTNDPQFGSGNGIEQYCIAVGRVRHVGETVAAVVAESRYIAEDALELIEVDYEELPVIATVEQGIAATGDGILHPNHENGNIAFECNYDFGTVEEDFAAADHVIQRELRWGRTSGMPIETSGAVASYNPGRSKFEVYSNSSMYNYFGHGIAASLRVPPSKLNVIPVYAGGSFGSKMFAHKVPTLTATLARAAGRPVKFIEDRIDHMLSSDQHGPERVFDCSVAIKGGKMTSVKIKTVDDYGAYAQFGVGHHGNALSQVTGPYDIGSVRYDLKAVLTNKCQQGAYRGFGAEVSNFMIERLVDAAADELGEDRVEFRRRNLIPKEKFPHIIPTGNLYDSGDYQAVLAKALDKIGYDDFRAEQEAALKEGRYLGIGVATVQERSVFSATEYWMLERDPAFPLSSVPESVGITVDVSGKVVVDLHAPFWGNSPETVVGQVVAELLGVDPTDIIFTYADTDHGLPSAGPAGSRYTVMISGAVVGATEKLVTKMKRMAAVMMGTDEEDVDFRDGIFITRSGNRSKTIEEIATAAYNFRLDFPDSDDFSSGLTVQHVYDHPLTTMPADDRSHLGIFYPIMGHMCHVPVVEVDIETGSVKILRYVAVHDCGTVVNPLTLGGHVRGGTAQGIGSALYEKFCYDENGQFTNASFADYTIPSAYEMPPDIQIGHVETPSPYTEFGVKGAGEGGRMGAPPAVVAAVEDALKPLGVRIDEIPIGPSRLREIIRHSTGG